MILQNMLLGETLRMVYLKCVSCNGKLVKITFLKCNMILVEKRKNTLYIQWWQKESGPPYEIY